MASDQGSLPADSEGFICPICMERLRSAETLQTHWAAAHSGGDGASATDSKSIAKTTKPPPQIRWVEFE